MPGPVKPVRSTPPVRSPSPPVPVNEKERLEALRSHAILDTPAERGFDELVELASQLCSAPVALLTLIDSQRQWFKASVGIDLHETPRASSFCAYAMLGEELFEVEDTHADQRFAANPFLVGDAPVRFYAGAPLRTQSGLGLGSLCVMDRVPRVLSPNQRTALGVLGRQVEALLRLRLAQAKLEVNQVTLEKAERQREELTALIVHDLKAPLAAILPNARFLLYMECMGYE
jgi:GAF domain-containing protein